MKLKREELLMKLGAARAKPRPPSNGMLLMT
jgi:hypothetical protein